MAVGHEATRQDRQNWRSRLVGIRPESAIRPVLGEMNSFGFASASWSCGETLATQWASWDGAHNNRSPDRGMGSWREMSPLRCYSCNEHIPEEELNNDT
jgi:DNA-directed RNA polymerase subunit N (RpoN/RPB10)